MNRLRQRLFVRALEDRTVPATFTVLNLSDSGADSLRDCISKANAAAGADTIAFNAGLTGTITLTTGEIAINGAVVIDGPGPATLKISGNNASRIFNTSSAATGTAVTVRDLTLTEANTSGTGGAILAIDEALTLINCAFSGNIAFVSGGAVAILGSLNGTLAATDCSFTGNSAITGAGGAIANFAGNGVKTTLQRCTVSGNTALQAGGLFAGTYLLVENSTISGNVATGTAFGYGGGGIRTEGFFAAGTLTVRNTTISGNSAGGEGGGIRIANAGSGTLVVQNSTITENKAASSGGGIARSGSGSISLESSVVSGNSATTGPDISSAGTVNVKTSAIGSGLGFTKTDQGGNLALGTNIKLGPLANNGGLTLTHLPAGDSPVIDAGSNPASLSSDQRGAGFPRAIGVVDIGTVEVLNLVVRNVADSGLGSLRQTIAHANTHPGADTITFDPAVFATPQTITMLGTEMAITDSATIIGPAAALTINAGAKSLHFTVFGTGTLSVSISSMTLTNGTSGRGGSIEIANEIVTLSKMTLSGNSAAGDGGAITIGAGAVVTIEDSTITGNSTKSSGEGGGINIDTMGKLTMLRCNLSGNTAGSNGGGIYFSTGGTLVMVDCTVSGNKGNTAASGQGGGGIYLYNTTATIRNSTISGNLASHGGGIGVFGGGTTVIQNSTIAFNTATNIGGGIIRTSTAAVTVESTIVGNNSAPTGPDVNGTIDTMNSSLVKNFSGLTITTGTGNLFMVDAKLDSLTNNGGATLTHALLAGSPAINTGSNPANLTTDQRGSGFSRVDGSGIDIGAFETQLINFMVTNANDSGAGSLRQAVLNANSVSGSDFVTFDPAFFATPQVINITTGEIAISEGVSIVGPTAKLTINGNAASRIFNTSSAAAGAGVNITVITLSGGAATTGGAITVGDEILTMTNCVVTGNSATTGGGGIDVTASTGFVILQNCTVSNNTSNAGGGLRMSSGGSLLIEGSTFSGNITTVGNSGGGIRFGGTIGAGGFLIRNSTFTGNKTGFNGGGVGFSTLTGTAVFQNCTFTGNAAGVAAFGGGGGIGANAAATISLESCIVSGNTSTQFGPDLLNTGTVNAKFCAIGSSAGVTTFNPDATTTALLGQPLFLGPLADNGGPTLTHALLAGSPAVNNGSNPAGLTNDQRGSGFARSAGQTDIGAFEVQSLSPAAKIVSVQINDGSSQRSRVNSVTINFDSVVSFNGIVASAFQLKRQSDNGSPNFTATALNGTATSVTLTSFSGSATDFGSLADGRYSLTVLASQINNFDGNGDGTPGDNFVMVGTPANGLIRLFGDADGDGTVAANDFIQFRLALGGNTSMFDFDGDGAVAASDFIQFRLRFGGSI